MPKKTSDSLKKPSKLDTIDKAIVQIKRKNPKLTLNAVANKIRDIGLVKSRQTIYRRYRKNDYLQREFAEVQAHEDERLLRQTGPKAVDQIDLVLSKGKVKRGPGKYEEVDAKTIVDTAKHVSKHHWGEKIKTTPTAGVSIAAIKNAQFIIQAAVSRNKEGQD